MILIFLINRYRNQACPYTGSPGAHQVCTTMSSLVAREGTNSVQDRHHHTRHSGILNQCGPAYRSNIIKFNTEESGRRHLRSSKPTQLLS